jgi:hypothetical protein
MIRLLTYLFILTSFSCSPVRVVSTETSDSVDFSEFRTFSFLEDKDTLANSPNSLQVRQAVQQELEGRGITLSDSPDLLINIALTREEKVQTRETDIRNAPVYMGTRNYHWESEEIVVREYEEGTVKVDVVDAESQRLVWQGIAVGTITGDKEKMKQRIQKGIEKLFNEFPIQP